MSAPLISVIVPTVGRPALLAKCIEGVMSGAFQDIEVVVVDQSTDDHSRVLLDQRFGADKRLRYFHSSLRGAARARNLGFEQARGEILAFIDDDAVPENGWLSAYAAAFRDIRPLPGMVAGRITAKWEHRRPDWFPHQLDHIFGAYDLGNDIREFPPGDFPMSGNFALPRAVMREVGGFDIRLGFDVGRRNSLLGGEDSHLALKVIHSGRRLYYHPGAEVLHLVRGEKLTLPYVLRRLYWNGRTYVQLRSRDDGDRRSWTEVLRDARAKRAQAGPRRTSPAAGVGARFVFAAAVFAFGLGTLAEGIAVRFGGSDG